MVAHIHAMELEYVMHKGCGGHPVHVIVAPYGKGHPGGDARRDDASRFSKAGPFLQRGEVAQLRAEVDVHILNG